VDLAIRPEEIFLSMNRYLEVSGRFKWISNNLATKVLLTAIFENLNSELKTFYIQIISGFFAHLRIIVQWQDTLTFT
jgi:hypothetical protein